jgi:signal peptidase II
VFYPVAKGRWKMPFFYVIIIVVILDQISKLLIQIRMTPLQSIDLFNGIVSITYARNSGAAFSILQSQAIFLSIITVAVFLVIWLNRRQMLNYPRIFQVGIAVALGGALGNFVDRIRLGYVVDFIDLHFWPVFNIADMAIVSGVGLIVWGLLVNNSTGKSKKAVEMAESHITTPAAGHTGED